MDIAERRDYSLNCLMFKCIHGNAPNYLSDRIAMKVDINEYETRSSQNMDVYLPTLQKSVYRNSLMYLGGYGWNALPPTLKDVNNISDFKMLYKKTMFA